jgi:hypothetical protein
MDGAQNVPRAGIVELVFGEPDPALLPVTEIRRRARQRSTAGARQPCHTAPTKGRRNFAG